MHHWILFYRGKGKETQNAEQLLLEEGRLEFCGRDSQSFLNRGIFECNAAVLIVPLHDDGHIYVTEKRGEGDMM
jgi:hypothetical protein